MPIVILGMHRSGTSAVTGMLEEQGIDLGPVRRKSNPHQPRGNRENPKVFKLDERVLEYNDGSWHSPPTGRVKFTDRHLARRNRVLASYESEPFAIKDPRMLLLLDFWRDLLERPIGVIRNPLSVCPLAAGPRGSPAATHRCRPPRALEGLQPTPCSHSAREREFPVIDFERREALAEQVAAALRTLRNPVPGGLLLRARAASATRSATGASRSPTAETLELWEELSSYARVAQLAQERAGAGLEGGDVLGRQLLAPAIDPVGRGRACDQRVLAPALLGGDGAAAAGPQVAGRLAHPLRRPLVEGQHRVVQGSSQSSQARRSDGSGSATSSS